MVIDRFSCSLREDVYLHEDVHDDVHGDVHVNEGEDFASYSGLMTCRHIVWS